MIVIDVGSSETNADPIKLKTIEMGLKIDNIHWTNRAPMFSILWLFQTWMSNGLQMVQID